MFQKQKTMLYFAPHQDDELLTMGIDICNSVFKKWDVHVIGQEVVLQWMKVYQMQ